MTLSLRRMFSRQAPECPTAVSFNYEPTVDLLLAWCGNPKASQNIEVEPGIFVRVDPAENRVLGIEVLDCAYRFHVEPALIDAEFAESLIDRYAAAGLSKARQH